MDVEHTGDPGAVFLMECLADDAVGKVAYVAAAGRGDSFSKNLSGGEWKLHQIAGCAVNEMWQRRCHRVAVIGAFDWEETRVVAVAAFEQSIESPFVAGRDGEAGCAISDNGFAAHLLQNSAGRAEVLAEFRGRGRGDLAVPPPMRGDFVAGVGDPADDLGVFVRDPAECEESAACVVSGEQVEQDISIASDA